MDQDSTRFAAALGAAMARTGRGGPVTDVRRLSGGANMESWLFTCGGEHYVLRRAPSAEWLAGRALDMALQPFGGGLNHFEGDGGHGPNWALGRKSRAN